VKNRAARVTTTEKPRTSIESATALVLALKSNASKASVVAIAH
jgi:hypothetical protein